MSELEKSVYCYDVCCWFRRAKNGSEFHGGVLAGIAYTIYQYDNELAEEIKGLWVLLEYY